MKRDCGSWGLGCLAMPILFLLLTGTLSRVADAKGLKELRVLFVGSERADEFVPFLQEHVSVVESVTREAFNPVDAEKFDLVILDWPQSAGARMERTKTSPLGERENWSRPTVLLGSAGLNLACAWQLRGGSG